MGQIATLRPDTNALLISYLCCSQIADFGLLRHAAKDETMTVNIKGTPAYMAPEGPYLYEVRIGL